jgi:glutaredoxin
MSGDQLKPLTVYCTSWCAQCRTVKDFLRQNHVPYNEIDVERVSGAAARLKRLAGGYESVPTVVFPDEKCLVEPPIPILRVRLVEMGYMPKPK